MRPAKTAAAIDVAPALDDGSHDEGQVRRPQKRREQRSCRAIGGREQQRGGERLG